MAAAQTITNFFTDTGIVAPAITTEQMREVDRIAMEETGLNLFQGYTWSRPKQASQEK